MFRWSIGERWMIYLVTKTRLLPSLVNKFLISLMAKIEQVLDLNLHLKRFQFRYMFKDM